VFSVPLDSNCEPTSLDNNCEPVTLDSNCEPVPLDSNCFLFLWTITVSLNLLTVAGGLAGCSSFTVLIIKTGEAGVEGGWGGKRGTEKGKGRGKGENLGEGVEWKEGELVLREREKDSTRGME
jgi:hypothetical protein